MSYKQLSITERENLLFHLAQGKSRCQIAKLLGRSKSTICRELAHNDGQISAKDLRKIEAYLLANQDAILAA